MKCLQCGMDNYDWLPRCGRCGASRSSSGSTFGNPVQPDPTSTIAPIARSTKASVSIGRPLATFAIVCLAIWLIGGQFRSSVSDEAREWSHRIDLLLLATAVVSFTIFAGIRAARQRRIGCLPWVALAFVSIAMPALVQQLNQVRADPFSQMAANAAQVCRDADWWSPGDDPPGLVRLPGDDSGQVSKKLRSRDYRTGPIFSLDIQTSQVDQMFLKLPAEVRSRMPSDTRTLACVRRSKILVGNYTRGGGAGYKAIIDVVLLDINTHHVLGSNSLTEYPPQEKASSGDYYSDYEAEKQVVEWLSLLPLRVESK